MFIMTNPYRDIFKAPGSFAFSASGLIARLPVSMITLGIVTMLSQTHGTYWLAGAVSAAFALSNALIAPQISRLIDRYGQRRVLPPVTVITVFALTALMLSARYGASSWMLFLFAISAGFMPSISAMVRARWTAIYRDTPKLHTAFALESVVDEIVYMVGPIVSIGLSVALFPEAGPLAATLFLTVGTLLFVAQRSTEPPVHAQDRSRGTSVIRLRPLQWIVLTLVAIGAIFGTAEVTAIAFAGEQGQNDAGHADDSAPAFRDQYPDSCGDPVPGRCCRVTHHHHLHGADRAPRAAVQTHRGHHMGNDGYRHRNGVGLIPVRTGDRRLRRPVRVLRLHRCRTGRPHGRRDGVPQRPDVGPRTTGNGRFSAVLKRRLHIRHQFV
jgi:Major Facilitator Superfamily